MKKPPNRRPVKPVQHDGRFHMNINGRTLDGEKIGKNWTFTCPAWPELVVAHNGAESAVAMLRAFMGLALADAVKIERS